MPTKKAYYRKPGHSSRSLPARRAQEGRGISGHLAVRVESVVVDEGVWGSIKKTEAQALKKMMNLVSEAREDSGNRTPGACLIIRMDPDRRIPKFEIEDAGTEPSGADDLHAALAEARERGVSRAVEILSGRDMLSAADFGKFIGVSREAVRTKHQRNEVLGLQGAKRGLRYPKWQVTSDGGLLPGLPRLFEVLGGESWTVYRFLTQHHPELEGDTALSGFAARQRRKSPCCRRKYRRCLFLNVARRLPPKGFESSGIEVASIKTGTKWFRLCPSGYSNRSTRIGFSPSRFSSNSDLQNYVH